MVDMVVRREDEFENLSLRQVRSLNDVTMTMTLS